MNKEQLIAEAARKAGMTQKEVRNGLNGIIETLVEAFENDTNVAIAGLGTFQVKQRTNVRKYLPENGKGPAKGVTGGRAIVVIGNRKYIQFNSSLQLKQKCKGTPSQDTKLNDKTD